jgi:hypothetical protein
MAILFLLSFFFAFIALATVLFDMSKREKTGERQEEKKSGHDALIITIFAMLRIGKRKIAHVKRLFLAYFLHVSVRGLRIFDRTSFFLYAKSRNMFIKNAVKHKGTVPFFWEYLKTYKQEIDREKERVVREEE